MVIRQKSADVIVGAAQPMMIAHRLETSREIPRGNRGGLTPLCYWKQWRKVRTRINNLLKIGTNPGVAIPICQMRKGPWKCARTLATQTGMTNQWLKDQGLVSVKEQWVKIHYPATAR
jgi:hypothetical protein